MNGLLLSFLVHGVLAGPIFDVLEYGAKGDNTTDDSSAIAAAFKDCSAASGGTVLFRSGHVFRTGPVAITCNDSVIMIEPGATLMARDTTDGWPYGLDRYMQSFADLSTRQTSNTSSAVPSPLKGDRRNKWHR
jgi:polygalacturonase